MITELAVTPATQFAIEGNTLCVDSTPLIGGDDTHELSYCLSMLLILQQVVGQRTEQVVITPDSKVELRGSPKARWLLIDNKLYNLSSFRADEDDLEEFVKEILQTALEYNLQEKLIREELLDKIQRRGVVLPNDPIL